ncbi:MAG: pirin family protein [Bacteroidetes bacterium]|nr:pirin family protein [Bacteroidota bacterium]HET6245849.1 pirin family protein [Bacteroidia bacterium]
MKKTIYPSNKRGFADHGWLKANRSFSFAEYYDPLKMHFGKLRVLNDDYISPGMGFPEHPHENMEIITLVINGALAHKDSMGHVSVINQGEVQIMSAGKGITHSEYNHSKSESINLLQIWVFPKIKNIIPKYGEKKFFLEDRINKFQTVVSPNIQNDCLWINQDAFFSLCHLENNHTVDYHLKNKSNGIYFFLIEGKAEIDGETLNKRDAIGIWETENLKIKSLESCDLLIIELPMN